MFKHFQLLYVVWYFLLLTMLQPLNAIAATEFKIIDLQHRFAEDILPIIQPLAGDDAAVTGMQNHLIIRASPEKMREIEQMIATFDVVRQNFKISVSRNNALQTERSGIDVSGRKRFGNVEVVTNSQAKNARSNAKTGIQLDIENQQSDFKSNSLQFIHVVDGETAFIRVGQSIPFSQEWVTLTHRYTKVLKTVEFINIDTGFIVRPRSLGNAIELNITPRIAQLNQSGFIDFEELSTTVRVHRGEWLNIAGIMQQNDEVSHAILSQYSVEKSQNSQLFILVE